jgi:hypothetical protein
MTGPNSTSYGHGTRTLAAAQALTQYDDNIEDAGNAPDFCASELVTNDNESVTIGVHVHNRDGFVTGDEYTALLETDAVKYRLRRRPPRPCRWTGWRATGRYSTCGEQTWQPVLGQPRARIDERHRGRPRTGCRRVRVPCHATRAERAFAEAHDGPSGRHVHRARVGAHAVAGRGTFTGSSVLSSWRLPRNAARQRLTGSVAVTFEGVKAAGSFAVRVG